MTKEEKMERICVRCGAGEKDKYKGQCVVYGDCYGRHSYAPEDPSIIVHKITQS